MTGPAADRPVLLGLVPWTPPEAVDVAARAAVDRDAVLLVVRVWSDRGTDPGQIDDVLLDHWDSVDARLYGEIERALSGVRQRLPGLRVRPLVVRDDPVSLLADLARGAQLLVLGRPVRMRRRAVARSVADVLLAAASCPVLVVPDTGAAPPRPVDVGPGATV